MDDRSSDGGKSRVTLTPEGEAVVPGVGVEFAMQCLARADALLQGIAEPDVVVHSAAHELHHALKVLRRAHGVPEVACSYCGGIHGDLEACRTRGVEGRKG